MAGLEVTQIVFLVVCLYAPRVPVHDGDRRMVRGYHIAGLQNEVGDVAVDWRNHLCTAQPPFRETGRRMGGRNGYLMKPQCFGCPYHRGLGGLHMRLTLGLLGTSRIQRLGGDGAGTAQRHIAAEVRVTEPRRRGCRVRLRSQIVELRLIDRQLRLGFNLLCPRSFKFQSERDRIDREKRRSAGDPLVVRYMHRLDWPGHFGGYRDEVGSEIGVIGVGKHVAGAPPDGDDQSGDQQDPDGAAAR